MRYIVDALLAACGLALLWGGLLVCRMALAR